MLEGEQEEQDIENLFENIMKENGELPQSGEGNRLPGSPNSSENPKKLDPRKHTPIITSPNINDKERLLKAAREKEIVTYKGVPIRLSAYFSKETL